MIRYIKKHQDIIVVTDTYSAHFDPASDSKYAKEYLAWVAEGNTAEEWSHDDAS